MPKRDHKVRQPQQKKHGNKTYGHYAEAYIASRWLTPLVQLTRDVVGVRDFFSRLSILFPGKTIVSSVMAPLG
ncbi:hypothetical protein OsJ_36128 [Oryza sativa Japonica Group]|jgi:hypothetical protein|uniref:Uncharacterized protein n=1 Tax=Oryza sativa subsp. japonica TaxID=39947 RepID=B9GD71_ORYSJ|nr:hypothetical protein OsJ_36128 [Oryza sativa Japonica Group]